MKDLKAGGKSKKGKKFVDLTFVDEDLDMSGDQGGETGDNCGKLLESSFFAFLIVVY